MFTKDEALMIYNERLSENTSLKRFREAPAYYCCKVISYHKDLEELTEQDLQELYKMIELLYEES